MIRSTAHKPLKPAPLYIADPEMEKAAFGADIMRGLSGIPKSLSSKYFYDGTGSRLFRKIMDLPEYYLTRTETAIFTLQQKEIIYSFAAGKSAFDLVDLGAGDAAKTRILLQEMLAENLLFTYIPIDISAHAMEDLAHALHLEMPTMSVKALASDYFTALSWLQHNRDTRKVVFFLGSNIGNFEPKAIRTFARRLRRYLKPGDQVLMGFDLKKEPHLIRQAYDDAAGITAAFNYNLLHRINHEFNGNMVVDQFRHFAEYNPVSGDMKSYLLPAAQQEIFLGDLNFSFSLEAWEPIHTETSHKFTLREIERLGQASGFRINSVFTDDQHYFSDVLLDVV
jgi:L-histidine N-alpha-methyltransferase